MFINRRRFLSIALFGAATQLPIASGAKSPALKKPPRLKVGDTVGLINPASIIKASDIQQTVQVLSALGLKVKLGKHLLDRYGYLAGKDADRAADLNAMFSDPTVQAILTIRGGWGCNRILPLLDYAAIRRHPKIIMGYSDITSLLLAITAKSGIVTFHGPVGTSKWNPFTLDYAKQVLWAGDSVTMRNTSTTIVETINPGIARGKLIGGNLSVLTAMLGSNYLTDWQQSILFVEEVGEDIYRIDRMLTQLKLAGILNQISGFIFGQCTNCKADNPLESLTLSQVFRDHLQPLNIPAWSGSMIGHIEDKFTLPLGVQVEVDASQGTIKMLESAVI